MNVKFLRKLAKTFKTTRAPIPHGGAHGHQYICPHCDGTGIEPHETSAYPPEPCSVCYGHPLIPIGLLDQGHDE